MKKLACIVLLIMSFSVGKAQAQVNNSFILGTWESTIQDTKVTLTINQDQSLVYAVFPFRGATRQEDGTWALVDQYLVQSFDSQTKLGTSGTFTPLKILAIDEAWMILETHQGEWQAWFKLQ